MRHLPCTLTCVAGALVHVCALRAGDALSPPGGALGAEHAVARGGPGRGAGLRCFKAAAASTAVACTIFPAFGLGNLLCDRAVTKHARPGAVWRVLTYLPYACMHACMGLQPPCSPPPVGCWRQANCPPHLLLHTQAHRHASSPTLRGLTPTHTCLLACIVADGHHRQAHKLYGHGNDVYCLAASPDGRYVASACKAQVRKSERDTGRQMTGIGASREQMMD